MRTVPLALIWEILVRGRWQMLLMTCAGNAFPLLLFTALRMQGELDFSDPAYKVVHLTLVQINMFIFGAGMMIGLGQMSRLYAYPVRNSTLVTWHLLPAMVLMALEMVAASAMLNALYNVHWPLWGPALFAAVALAAVLAVMWLTEKSVWLPWSVGLVGAALGLWFKTRHGPLFEEPKHYWEAVTLWDGITLGCIAVVAHITAVYAVSRNRRGETWPALGIVAWFDRLSEPGSTATARFTSPTEAHLWFEWRKKGWAMPVCVIFGMVMGCGLWVIFNRDPKVLVGVLVMGGGVMMGALGMVGGLIIGHCGSTEATPAMGHFLATRPLTNPQLARILLWNAAKSVWYAWLLWVIPVVVLSTLVVATGLVHVGMLDSFLRESWWWYLPAALIGPWIVCACLATVTLTGRTQPFVSLALGAFVLAFVTNVTVEYALTSEQRWQFWRVVSAVFSVGVLLGTVWLFAIARRRELIAVPAVWGSLAVWCVFIAGLVVSQVLDPRLPTVVCLFLAAAMALAVAPFAGAPLALAWNRTR